METVQSKAVLQYACRTIRASISLTRPRHPCPPAPTYTKLCAIVPEEIPTGRFPRVPRLFRAVPAAFRAAAPLTEEPAAAPAPVIQAAPGTSRDNPAVAKVLSRKLLNKPGSEKETWHVEFDLAECGLDYTVGDAFGLFPANDPALVEAVIRALGAPVTLKQYPGLTHEDVVKALSKPFRSTGPVLAYSVAFLNSTLKVTTP